MHQVFLNKITKLNGRANTPTGYEVLPWKIFFSKHLPQSRSSGVMLHQCLNMAMGFQRGSSILGLVEFWQGLQFLIKNDILFEWKITIWPLASHFAILKYGVSKVGESPSDLQRISIPRKSHNLSI